MRKVLFVASAASALGLLLLPASAGATSWPLIKPEYTTQVDAGVGTLRFGVLACKAQPCTSDSSDWFNYASLADGSGGSGEGATLVASPGDTITFLGEVKYDAPDDGSSFNPVFSVDFSEGAAYLESINYFDTGNDNIDGDDIGFVLGAGTDVTFSQALHRTDSVQFGSITATIMDGVPDGTVIEGQLSVDGEQFFTDSGFVSSAYAASVAQSGVRIVVNNPQVAPSQVTPSQVTPAQATTAPASPVLPKTGAPSGSRINPLALAMLTGLVLFGGYRVVSRKRRSSK